jgi:hypothetical protein
MIQGMMEESFERPKISDWKMQPFILYPEMEDKLEDKINYDLVISSRNRPKWP